MIILFDLLILMGYMQMIGSNTEMIRENYMLTGILMYIINRKQKRNTEMIQVKMLKT